MYKAEREILENRGDLKDEIERLKQIEIDKQVLAYKEQVLSKILEQESDEVKAIKKKIEEDVKLKQKELINRLRQQIDEKNKELDRINEEDKRKDQQIEELENYK